MPFETDRKLVLATSLLLALCGRADAEGGPAFYGPDRLIAGSLHLGLGTPYGAAGLEAEVSPLEHVAIAAGFGEGFAGTQVAAAVRLREVRRSTALGISAGLGFGTSSEISFVVDAQEHYKDALWANAEAFAEKRWQSGFLLRGYAGLTVALDFECEFVGDSETLPCGDDGPSSVIWPVVGVAIGWAPALD